MNSGAIRVEGLTRDYGRFRALDHVNLTIEPADRRAPRSQRKRVKRPCCAVDGLLGDKAAPGCSGQPSFT
jgi:hypothetical protein